MIEVGICKLLVHVAGLSGYLVVLVLCGFSVDAHFCEKIADVVELFELELVET